jgi:hypothetical protein
MPETDQDADHQTAAPEITADAAPDLVSVATTVVPSDREALDKLADANGESRADVLRAIIKSHVSRARRLRML